MTFKPEEILVLYSAKKTANVKPFLIQEHISRFSFVSATRRLFDRYLAGEYSLPLFDHHIKEKKKEHLLFRINAQK